jgi:hypothetical protein
MRLPDGSDRKRKVTELFGDISDIELEDLDSLENPCCKWETLMLWGTNLFREANKYYCEIQHKMSLYCDNFAGFYFTMEVYYTHSSIHNS